MSHRFSAARPLRAGCVALAAAAVASPSALAADAPTRRIDLSPSGRITDNLGPVAISPNGREILLNQFDPADATQTTTKPPRIVIRDVVAGTTTVLSEYDETALAASEDLGRILFGTKRQLSPDDQNTSRDLYLHDRRTGKNLLVTRGSTGGPALGQQGFYESKVLSGDGNAVFFSRGDTSGYNNESAFDLLRFDAATNTISTVARGAWVSHDYTDRTGRIIATEKGIYVDGKRLPTPAGWIFPSHQPFIGSPDGRVLIAYENHGDGAPYDGTHFVTIDTATGATKRIPFAAPLADQHFETLAVNENGTDALATLPAAQDADGFRNQLWLYNLATGAAKPYGGTLGSTNIMGQVINKTWDFYADNLAVAQIGATPIGGTPVIPTRPPASQYVSYNEGCRYNPAAKVGPKRPSVTLRGPDGQEVTYPFPTPSRAIVTVKGDAGLVTNLFSMGYGATTTLRSGYGGFTYTATVVFPDGVRSTVSQHVPRYSPRICFPFDFPATG